MACGGHLLFCYSFKINGDAFIWDKVRETGTDRETKLPFSKSSSTFFSFSWARPDRNYSWLCVRLSVFWEVFFPLSWSWEIPARTQWTLTEATSGTSQKDGLFVGWGSGTCFPCVSKVNFNPVPQMWGTDAQIIVL